jgi:hypothetical protein
VEVVGGVEGLVAGDFERGDGGVEFAGGDFGGSGVDVAELAGGQVGFAVVARDSHGWTEGAADDGAGFVEVAGAGGGVEDGAGLVVGELFKEGGGLLVFGEDAIGGGIVGVASSGKPRVEAGERGGDAGVDAGGSGGVGLGQGGEAFAEAGGVLLRDGEDSDAALGAAGAADKVRTAALRGGGEGGGYDLDQVRRHGSVRDFRPFGVCTAHRGVYHGFVHGKGVAVLYIQILIDGKGVASVYIQIGMLGGGWFGRAKWSRIGEWDVWFITKGLRFCIYKYWLMIKGLRACIYKRGCWCEPARPNQLGRGTRSGLLDHAIEFFKMFHPANRARPEGRAAVCFCIYYTVPVKLFARLEGIREGRSES